MSSITFRRSGLVSAVVIAVSLAAMPNFMRRAGAAPDNTLGTAIMFAFVGGDGTLLNGSGATGAVKGSGLGGYRVTFDRDISSCGYSATVYNAIGRTAVVMPSDDNATVIVATSTSQNLADNAFYLLVYCSR